MHVHTQPQIPKITTLHSNFKSSRVSTSKSMTKHELIMDFFCIIEKQLY